MEMRNKFINRARNVWDRAVKLLPRIDQFWYKYSYMEEMVGDAEAARAVFERWMTWEPSSHAWTSYARVRAACRRGCDTECDPCLTLTPPQCTAFSSRCAKAKLNVPAPSTTGTARATPRYVAVASSGVRHARRPTLTRMRGVGMALQQVAYIKFAKWELRQGQPALARAVFERAVAELGDVRDSPVVGYRSARAAALTRLRAMLVWRCMCTAREGRGTVHPVREVRAALQGV